MSGLCLEEIKWNKVLKGLRRESELNTMGTQRRVWVILPHWVLRVEMRRGRKSFIWKLMHELFWKISGHVTSGDSEGLGTVFQRNKVSRTSKREGPNPYLWFEGPEQRAREEWLKEMKLGREIFPTLGEGTPYKHTHTHTHSWLLSTLGRYSDFSGW